MGDPDIRLDPMRPEDWDEVRRIYQEGIATGHATFETAAPAWNAWDAAHLPEPRLVARAGSGRASGGERPSEGGGLLAWAALSRVSDRCVYAGVAEVSVYVGAAARGRGVGRALLDALIEGSEREGIWTLQAGIFPANAASLELHRRCGFREIGRREKLGKLGGVWRDVLLLERRSLSVGTG
jgi:L-amino acid N-acyltransferase YncA